MLMKTLIVLLFVSILWSCAATRHTTVPADVQNEVMRLVEDRDYRVLFGRQFLTPDGVYLLNGESGMLTVSGNVLVYASFPSDQQVMLRIRDYRLSLTKKGEVEITPEMTGGELHDTLSQLGAKLIVETLRDLEHIQPQKQDDALSCYAAKIDKAEAKLDFNLSAEVLERKIRAFNPYPATYFMYEGERFKVLKAEALDGASGRVPGSLIPNDTGLLIECNLGMLLITEIQRQGKKAMTTEELLRGFSFKEETILE